MGYDLLNEPWPGSAFGPQGCAQPGRLPDLRLDHADRVLRVRVLDAIRTVDPETLIFYEPLVTFDFGADTGHGDTGDPPPASRFHNYCLPGAFGGPGSGPSCEPLEDMVFDNADKQCGRDRRRAVPDRVRRHRRPRDDRAHRRASPTSTWSRWQYWHYCDCDDPTTAGPGSAVGRHRPGASRRAARTSSATKLRLLARPYPRAVAGTPHELRLRPRRAALRARLLAAAPDGERAAAPPRHRGLPARGSSTRDGVRGRRAEGRRASSRSRGSKRCACGATQVEQTRGPSRVLTRADALSTAAARRTSRRARGTPPRTRASTPSESSESSMSGT